MDHSLPARPLPLRQLIGNLIDDTTLWWRDGVIYQIYPRSFADSDGDGIGDLAGIIQRLDYLQELGVSALWLSPIFPSPDVDFGYDVSDYMGIDPKYGCMADFDRLLEEAHRRGMRIILDMVLNHTSDQHPWFQSARSSPDSPYRDWYIWRPAKDGKLPNNWASRFGGPAWEWDEQAQAYYLHTFFCQQPDVNWRNPQLRRAMLDVMCFWLDKGVDGFRLDVFNAFMKDEQLRSNPIKAGLIGWDQQKHVYDHSRPEMLPLLAEIRAILDSYADRYAIGETFEAGTRQSASYIGAGKLHGGFDFEFLRSPWKPARFQQAILSWENALGEDAWPTYVLNNHDQSRSANRYARGENDAVLKVAATMLLTQRGTPFLYYGEEIGQRDIRCGRDEILDPVGKRYWPFYRGRDGCRAPMQWDDSPQAGFTSGQPWLPVHDDFGFRNVAAQQEDQTSLWYVYRQLIALRKDNPALRRGLFLPLVHEPRTVMAYLRQSAEQTLLVALNFRRSPNRLALGGTLRGPQWELLFSTHSAEIDQPAPGTLALQGYEAVILRQR